MAVVVIGWLTIRLAMKANHLSEEAVDLANRSTSASERSAEASVQAAQATEASTTATMQAAEASERSVAASELAARLAAQDAKVRRVEALLEVLLDMRATFNEQHRAHEDEGPWVPGYGSPEALERLALCRRLEVRLVPFDEVEIPSGSTMPNLTVSYNWSNGQLETAIETAKELLRRAAGRPQHLTGESLNPSSGQ